jgi:hypothetical protein
MKLRQNEYCPIHRSLRCCGREQTQCVRRIQPGIRRIEALKIPIRGDIENSDPQPKCGNF